MKKTALLIIALVGVGSVLVPGGASAVDIFNTNIVGAVNTKTSDAWVITNNTAMVITDSTITASNWNDKAWITAIVTNASSYFYSLGNGGLMYNPTAKKDMTVTNSTITGSDGGVITVVSNVIGSARFCVDGGDGMLLKNVNGAFTNATIAGGNGGTIIAQYAGRSTANAGFGLKLQGTTSTVGSTLHATNSIFKGGNGGEFSTNKKTGDALGGDGIVVEETKPVVLDFSDDTQVIGGDGGSVSKQETISAGKADGGSALWVNAKSGTTTLTIKGGTFVGGKAGTIAGQTMQAGKSIYVTGYGRANLTLEGGNFDDGILIANTSASTLALKSTFTNNVSLDFRGETLKITEWTDGQLSDVTVSGNNVISIELAGTNEFNLYGSFIVGGSGGRAIFSSGLVVKSGGTLNLGTNPKGNTATFVHTETNSTIIAPIIGTYMGTLKSSGSLTLDAGTKWEIVDNGQGVIGVGQVLTLATTSNTNNVITNNLNLSDVHLINSRYIDGRYFTITSITNTETSVQAVCGLRDIIDFDADGLDDEWEECIYRTDPTDADSDDDGLTDGEEINTYNTNPIAADSDQDGLSDGDEVHTYGTDPGDSDCDDDGLSDGEEMNMGTGPLLKDSDGDGISDGHEFNVLGSDPLLWDTDGDGYGDATLFVCLSNGLNASAPYTTWATAATNIQDALEFAADGWVILVEDGHYMLDAELRVENQITIRSVNGPETTIVDGQGSVRCFYLENTSCVIEGLTITNAYSENFGGGIYCDDTTPVITNCVVVGNSSDSGGGMYQGTAYNCMISGNSSPQYRYGGGLFLSTAYNCTISGNSGGFGGGMDGCTAYDCTISGNTADCGGGAEGCTLTNCTIFGNMAYEGGGVANSTLSNCAIFGNFAANTGGGCDESVLTHCTITGNTSDVLGGGTSGCTLTNCIVYANTAFSTDDNWVNDTFSYSCTTPLPEGEGNISADPMLLGPSHIHSESPCVGAGSADDVSATDIDGDAWNTPSSMGCDEPSAPFDGTLSVSISMEGSKIAKGYALGFFAEITGEVTSNRWAFGDGESLPNTTYPAHAFGEAGNYDVVLTAWNDDFPDGVSATAQVQVVASSTYYVNAGNTSPVAPYTSWATAATTIQDAVDIADDTWGSTVLVADGFYTAGGAVTPGFSCMNRVVITNDITVQSVNGPEYTYIVGEGPLGSNAVRGVYMSSGILSGFTITNGHTMTSGQIYYDCMGGGVSLNAGDGPTIRGGDGLVTNCILVGNASDNFGGGCYKGSLFNCTIIGNTASGGGGSYYCSLYNCIISGNSALEDGGGIYQGTANNCTITGNSASDGGGMYYGTANNCTISGNSAEELGGGIYNATVNNCIVWYNEAPTGNDLSSAIARFSCSPYLTHGIDGNITNSPLLTADGHVAWNSPCRGAGNMAYATGTDIDGEAWGNPPSIGCDEYHGEGEDWLQVMIESCDTIVANGFPLSFRRHVEGPANLVVWDFGDGTQITNSISVEHAWAASGTFNVVLTAYNVYWPDGVSATQEVSIVSFEETAIYVSPNGNDANDGSSWESAKKTIQAGVDAQDFVGGGVLVGSGTYSLSATITVTKPVRIVGVDGPGSTIVDGQDSVRCFDLGNTACVIEGLTIKNGDCGDNGGGGIYCSDTTPVVANCFITGNRALSGGGVYNGTANNCTISGNTASEHGGGMCVGTANNCIVYGNTSPTGNDLYDTTAKYSCSPDVTHGANGNITNAPMFVTSSHIAANSPCRGAGSADYATGKDIDGEAWANPPSMGCDEPYGTTGGNINVSFTAGEGGVLPGEMIAFKGMIEGAALMHVWNFGDGTQVTNSLSVEHTWAESGTFNVVLTAYNADWSDGVSATQEVWIASMEDLSIRVSPDGDDTNDGRSWANAKATIQAGIDAQELPGGWILVGSGTYSLSATITVSKPVRIVGADGQGSTIVDGQGSVSCFNLGNTACVIEGLTITNGYTGGNGGGIYCSGMVPVVTNCTISGNTATQKGGGMYRGTANNCTISGNTALNGGGMYEGTANNCTISGNSGRGMYGATANNCTITENLGGGTYRGTANNCIVWYSTTGKDIDGTTARYSCSPDVTHGVGGNITNAPVFVSSSHIAADSPCSGAGSADYAAGTDIDGESWANPPSMGCDEPAEFPRGPVEVAFVANQSMVLTGCPIQFKGQIHGALSAHIWDFGDGTRVANSLSVEHAWVVPGIYNVVLTAYNADSPGGVSATQEVSIVSFEESAIHVSLNGNDANDGASWESAKATIQAGVDAQDIRDGWVLVGSGTYSLSATITVSKPVRILSVDGPGSTIVNGKGSVRCFNLGNTACVIEGLTITNGYAGIGGGIYCLDTTPVVTNCTISGNRAGVSGGGMCKGTANNCTVSGNSAGERGGGMNGSTANNCTISGNRAGEVGGGMNGSTANNCTVSGNMARDGGGMSSCTANNCTVIGNTASRYGGGTYAFIANNCTVIGNTSSQYGGGMYEGTANNCIVWYNTSPSGKDLYNTTARYSCSPEVTHGANGNITNAPVFTISSRIAADSPCRGKGSADYATGTDIDGEAWANPPSMGCDEPYSTTGGDITVSFTSSENKVLPGEMIAFKGMVEGAALMYVWDFSDGTQVTNSLSVEHVWAALGTYDVVLTAYNADWPNGVSATQEVSIVSLEGSAIHVSPDGNDTNDGTSWASAKATIQAGVDAQDLRDGWILIDGGTYSLSETITVSNPVHIVGVNGAESTIVDGQGNVRCFNLGNTACVIEGLTITNGYTSGDGGGIYCSGIVPIVTNCTISGNVALSTNIIYNGGSGGGMVGGTANNCTISGNSAKYGGGISGGTANNCTISDNSARNGGGMYRANANNCTISDNSASLEYGGGMYEGTANNCTIFGNSAPHTGGGMYKSTANNCTITGNSAFYGSGMSEGTANNCIVCYNLKGNNFYSSSAYYTCSPDLTHGVNGNITNAPMLASSSHIAADSPCRGKGSTDYATGTDIDGNVWANPPSMGCDEPSDDLLRGTIEVNFVANDLMMVPYYPIQFHGQIHGALSEHVWDFGDGTQITNSLPVVHAWASAGIFDVVLTAYNADFPGGVSATQKVTIVSFEETAIHVSLNGNDANDGRNWASAKATIQAGVDAQGLPSGWVFVGSGTYSLSAAITVSNPVHIVGVDGSGLTIVDGQGCVSCFDLGDTASVIEGLTITNGYAENGGGIYCSDTTPVVANCTISGNSATRGGGMHYGTANNCTISGNSTRWGGGMYYGVANNCTISDNSATNGGGMYNGMANNCTINGNSATYGGGMAGGTAKNTIVYGNTAPNGKNFYHSSAYYTCSPDLTHGVNGNITNVPLFVDAANGDYRLAAGSPCIDAGSNGYVVGALDLAGLPRIAGGVVDMGAYEYYNEDDDEDGDGMPNWWEATHFGSILGSAPTDDYDNDLFDNISEWIAGTNPSDPNSVFVVSVSTNQIPTGFVIEWTSVEGRSYSVRWRETLTDDYEVLQDEIEYPQNSYTDTLHNAESSGFYRVEVRMP